MGPKEVLKQLQFAKPYLFVDEIHYVNEDGVSGSYTFREEENLFYKGHFIKGAVTPGAILAEAMQQIGGSCLERYLNRNDLYKVFVATSVDVEFYKPVFPNERVTVESKKIYYRFDKLKYSAIMKNEKGELVAKGMFTGMSVHRKLKGDS